MTTWILVADQARARLFESQIADGALAELADYAHPEALEKPSEVGYQAPPRVHESASSTRHAITPHTAPRDKVALEFAHGLSEVLDRGRVENHYDRLILVAPPRFLGQLKGVLDEQVRKLVVRTVGRNITRASIQDISAELDDVL